MDYFFHPRQLYPKQRRAFCGGGPHIRFRYCEASSGSGKTWGAGGVALNYASNLKHNEKICWMTHTYDACEIGFDSVLDFIPYEYREIMEKKKDITYSHGNMKISLASVQAALGNPGFGATIEFRSAQNPQRIYGGRYRAGFVDEASRCIEESIHALLSTLNKGGQDNPCWLWGNVVNRHNYFFRTCRQVQQEMRQKHVSELRSFYSEMTYHDALDAVMRYPDGSPVMDDYGNIMHVQTPEAIEDARIKYASMPGMFDMLYENRPINDDTRPYPDDVIDAISTHCQCGREINPYVLCEYCYGLSSKPPVAAGWDVARQVDFNAIVMLDEDGRACEFHHWKDNDWYSIARKGAELLMGVPTLLDISGKGDALPDILRNEHPEVWEFITPIEDNTLVTHTLDTNLIRATQNRELVVPIGTITEQLAIIEATKTATGIKYEAPKGMFDDAVDALSLAAFQWRHRRSPDRLLTKKVQRDPHRRTGWTSRRRSPYNSSAI